MKKFKIRVSDRNADRFLNEYEDYIVESYRDAVGRFVYCLYAPQEVYYEAREWEE